MADAQAPGGTLVAYWCQPREAPTNFGDALNPWLLQELFHCTVMNHSALPFWRRWRRPVLYGCGSILERDKASMRRERSAKFAWGTGTRGSHSLAHWKNGTVSAVRGPLTRRKLLADGVKCPERYGDPAILLPQVLPAAARASGRVVMVPHYVELDACLSWVRTHSFADSVDVVDVRAPLAEVVAAISAAAAVLSSSLHGIIVADAYGVPNARVTFAGGISGGDFKFDDYGHAVGRGALPAQVMQTADDYERASARLDRGDSHGLRDDLLAAFPCEVMAPA